MKNHIKKTENKSYSMYRKAKTKAKNKNFAQEAKILQLILKH